MVFTWLLLCHFTAVHVVITTQCVPARFQQWALLSQRHSTVVYWMVIPLQRWCFKNFFSYCTCTYLQLYNIHTCTGIYMYVPTTKLYTLSYYILTICFTLFDFVCMYICTTTCKVATWLTVQHGLSTHGTQVVHEWLCQVVTRWYHTCIHLYLSPFPFLELSFSIFSSTSYLLGVCFWHLL